MRLKPMRIKLLCLIVMLVFCQLHIPAVQAAPIPCDGDLFLAGILTAFRDPTPPPLDFEHMHWEFVDSPYQVDYWWDTGFSGFVQRVTVKQGKRTVGVATNGQWSVCAKGNGWKNYLLGHLP